MLQVQLQCCDNTAAAPLGCGAGCLSGKASCLVLAGLTNIFEAILTYAVERAASRSSPTRLRPYHHPCAVPPRHRRCVALPAWRQAVAVSAAGAIPGDCPATMRIKVELEVAPDEVPLATELLAVLRCDIGARRRVWTPDRCDTTPLSAGGGHVAAMPPNGRLDCRGNPAGPAPCC